jgi:hypothetical protein
MHRERAKEESERESERERERARDREREKGRMRARVRAPTKCGICALSLVTSLARVGEKKSARQKDDDGALHAHKHLKLQVDL